ncbi:MAG: Rpn family recombination-promoting nuclease/putative transposase [Bacteroidales bacterium]|nr:Rpn family recombination-promoting nuclease/putative transposase [Bacteroidales bacterium]
MSKYLDPKADLTFKKVFGEHPNLVLSLLNALLPLPEGMEIKTVEYLSPENIPENPGKKYSIVDVYCTDNYNRHFIVEMQSYWNTEFFSRTLFNAASMYAKQLEKGKSFGELKDVYALCLVNDIKAFPEYGNEYIQEYYLTNKNHAGDIHTDLSMVFIVLPNYTPQNRAEKKMRDLWLRFLTEIDENTDDAAPELLANEETFEALEIVRRSAFTPGELLTYNQYWLDISTEKSAMERERREGREEGEEVGFKKGHKEGRAEGIAEGEKLGIEKGEKQKALTIARNLKAAGLDIDFIAQNTGLTKDEILTLI